MNNTNLTWKDFKEIAVKRSLSIQWISDGNFYFLEAIDGPVKYVCVLDRNPSDVSDLLDFEINFKPSSNQSFSDIDGIPLIRIKASKKGWTFWAMPVEVTTSTLGSIYCKNSKGQSFNGVSLMLYDENDNEIISQEQCSQCVKTVVDFTSDFDYEIIGGELYLKQVPAEDVRLWVVAAPHIPAQYGGSKEFISGLNLSFIKTGKLEIDGRVTKYVEHNTNTLQSKVHLILKHPKGLVLPVHFVFHTYKQ